MDAAVDLPEDAAHGRYNPLAGYAEGKSEEELHALLTVLIGEAAEQFERLPLVRDVDLMRNILYSGVWLRYNLEMEKNDNRYTYRDPYEVLGVSRDASDEEVKAAYRALAKKYHPTATPATRLRRKR